MKSNIIPEDVERVLFLDIDMIVDGSLKDVYNMEFPKGVYFLKMAYFKKHIQELLQI